MSDYSQSPDDLPKDWGKGMSPPSTRPTPAQIIASPEVKALVEAAEYFAKKRKSIMADIGSAHSSRGAGASSWMREDDNDFYHGLGKALDDLSVALAQLKEPKP